MFVAQHAEFVGSACCTRAQSVTKKKNNERLTSAVANWFILHYVHSAGDRQTLSPSMVWPIDEEESICISMHAVVQWSAQRVLHNLDWALFPPRVITCIGCWQSYQKKKILSRSAFSIHPISQTAALICCRIPTWNPFEDTSLFFCCGCSQFLPVIWYFNFIFFPAKPIKIFSHNGIKTPNWNYILRFNRTERS